MGKITGARQQSFIRSDSDALQTFPIAHDDDVRMGDGHAIRDDCISAVPFVVVSGLDSITLPDVWSPKATLRFSICMTRANNSAADRD
jgi:hypothetical protein